MAGSKRKVYLPNPAELAEQLAALRAAKGMEPLSQEAAASSMDDWRDYETERAELAETGDVLDRDSLVESRLERKANLIREQAAGIPQRTADANDGTEPKAGTERSHWKAWNVRDECKRMFRAGKSVADVMRHYGIAASEKRVVQWLEALRILERLRKVKVKADAAKPVKATKYKRGKT